MRLGHSIRYRIDHVEAWLASAMTMAFAFFPLSWLVRASAVLVPACLHWPA
jgi:hypothetical protein